MNICEATKQAMKEERYIARKMWGERGRIYIEPTNSPFCCLIMSKKPIAIKPYWNPNMDDLTADDWYVY